MQQFAVFFLAGLCLLHTLPALPPWWTAVMLFALPAVAVRWRCAAPIAAVALGFLWGWWHADSRLDARLPVAADGARFTVYGTVVGLPQGKADQLRFRIRTSHSVELPRLHVDARLVWYDSEVTPAPGEVWRLQVRLRAPRGFANPRGFDYEKWLFGQGIGATGYVVNGVGNERIANAGVRAPLTQLRAALAANIRDAIPDHALLPVVLALTVGDRSAMTADHWDAFSGTGTGHLMAISGLHIGMVAGAAFLFARLLAGGLPARLRRVSATDCALIVALASAITYAGLAGFTLPTQRALVMLAMLLFALQQRRRSAAGMPMCAALLLVMLLDPFAPLSAGLWLSFGAVAVIVYATSGYCPGYSGWRAWGRVQFALSVGLLPVSLWLFGRVSLLAPLLNLVLIPLFSFVLMPLVLSGMVLCVAWPAGGGWLLLIGANLLGAMFEVLYAVSQWRFALWTPSPRPGWTLVLATAAAVLMLGPGSGRQRLHAVLLFMPLLVWRPAPLPPGGFSLTVLDVGQGLACIVTTRGHRLVYDTGGRFRSGSDAASLVILPFLRAGSAPTLLLVSHGDLDHRGGLDSLVRAYPDARLLGSHGATAVNASDCSRGQSWQWDSVRFDILHPVAGGGFLGNDASCVLKVSSPAGSVLLAGDIEAHAEQALVAYGSRLAADVVVAPHHGSETSSTQAFVNATGARHVVFAAGFGNRWRFPRQRIVERWQQAGARVWTSGNDGAISVTVNPDDTPLSVQAYRDRNRRYWSARRQP